MAAISRRATAARVLLLERTRDGGRKILISGGGRCNVLPSALAPERFVTDSSRNTLRSLLRSWPLAEQRRSSSRTLGLPLALEDGDRQAVSRVEPARDVRDALVALRARAGSSFVFDGRVAGPAPTPARHWRMRRRPTWRRSTPTP